MVVVQPDLALRLHRRLLPQTAQEPTAFWSESVAYQLRLDPTAEHAVFFIGDSLVQSLHVGGIVAAAVNYGIGGDTIGGVRRRLPLYHSLATARAIVLAIGANDLLTRDAAAASSDYEALVSELPAGVPLILSAVLPVDQQAVGNQLRRLTNGEIMRLNATIERLCAQRKKCIFLDVGAELRDREGRLARAFQVGDGVHLNAAGYRIWSAALSRALSTLLQEG
jgi:lysophospholipase L1-like esterase